MDRSAGMGDPERAWDLFIERYRRLIFGAIRRYTAESDDVMDVFARCTWNRIVPVASEITTSG